MIDEGAENLDELSRSRPGRRVPIPVQHQEATTDVLLQAKFASHAPLHLVLTTESTEATEDLSKSFRKFSSEAVRKIISDRMDNSKVANKLSISEIPKFDIHELTLGKRLGTGGFSNVDEIRDIFPQSNKVSSMAPAPKIARHDSVAVDDKESRQFIAAHCIRASGDCRYALKTSRRAVVNDEE